MTQYLDHAPCVYFETIDQGTLVQVNYTLCEVLGYKKEELLGQKVETIFTVATKIFQQTHFFPLLKMSGHVEEIFISLQTKGGVDLPILVNAVRREDADPVLNQYVGIIVHNRKKFEDELIVARKTAETALKENTILNQLKNELEQSLVQLDHQLLMAGRQNEELKQYSHVITHELQEPLRKLFLFSDLLKDPKHINSDETLAVRIRQVGQRMKDVVSGLQQFIWLNDSSPLPEIIHPASMIRTLVQQYREIFPNLEIEEQIENLPSFEGDAEQINFLFEQLIKNAIDFRKPGNLVQIQVRGNTVMKNRFVKMPGKFQYGQYIKIDFTDQGIGFDARFAEQVFNLFRKLHTQGGQGIGLSLCRKIISNHQGHIQIYAEKNRFTRVTIYMPQAGTKDVNQTRALLNNEEDIVR